MVHKKFLEIINVDKTFAVGGRGRVEVLSKINLTIAKNEFVSIIGHSGCGKSTLLSMIAGLEPVTEGSICFKEREISRPGPERAVVFQHHSLLPWRTVVQNVMLAVNAVFPQLPKAERRAKAERWLTVVGLKDHMAKYPHEISGGMKQRTGIARALAMEPEVLLLDEPFGALDALTRSTLQDEVLRLHYEEHLTVFMVTHDIDEAVLLSDRVVMMNNGPRATIGQFLDIDWVRPRERIAFMESERFAHYRNECMRFLFWRHRGGGHAAAGAPPAAEPVPSVEPIPSADPLPAAVPNAPLLLSALPAVLVAEPTIDIIDAALDVPVAAST